MPKPLPQVYSFIIPLRTEFINRVFRGKTVIGKFMGKIGSAKRIKEGTIILFYETKKNQKIIGQAVVEKAELKVPMIAFKENREQFFLTQNELTEYIHKFPGREDKEMLVMHLKNVIAFSEPVIWKRSPSMAGLYMDYEEYKQYFGK